MRPPAAPAEIDAVCRAPVLFLFASAAVWLVVASILALVSSLKFHAPGFLADCPWFTYGRVQPAQINALAYGFAAQAALGVVIWMVARLGRTLLVQPALVLTGAIFWNLGVTIGLFGILIGDTTGYEWMEMPGYASPILFGAYVLSGVPTLLTFHQRREPALYVAQWFLLAAMFWFPWIYSTANLLLVFFPARGVMQAVVNWWYIGNLTSIWFGFVGLAAIFYLLPKLAQRPLLSNYLAMLAFWSLSLCGGWGGIHHQAPLPSWMPSLSTVFTVLTVVPLIAIALNLNRTFAGASAKMQECLPLRFVVTGAAAYLLSGALAMGSAFPQVGQITQFTLFTPARTQLFLYGFFAMTMFGAIYHIVPLLSRNQWPAPKLARLHFGLATLGLALYAGSLTVGGILQGQALNDPRVPFADALNRTLMCLRLGTLGDLLMAAGNGALALNLGWLLVRCRRAALVPAPVGAAEPQLAQGAR